MSALAEKLKSAGVDTIGAQLTAACTHALRRYPNNLPEAWREVGASFGFEFLQQIAADMAGPLPNLVRDIADGLTWQLPDVRPDAVRDSALEPALKPPQLTAAGRVIPAVVRSVQVPKPYTPRVIRPERQQKMQELRQVVRSKFKNSAGVAWSDIGWHELTALRRDGNEAAALLDAAPANVPNDGRSVGEVLGVRIVDEIIAKIRSGQVT